MRDVRCYRRVRSRVVRDRNFVVARVGLCYSHSSLIEHFASRALGNRLIGRSASWTLWHRFMGPNASRALRTRFMRPNASRTLGTRFSKPFTYRALRARFTEPFASRTFWGRFTWNFTSRAFGCASTLFGCIAGIRNYPAAKMLAHRAKRVQKPHCRK